MESGHYVTDTDSLPMPLPHVGTVGAVLAAARAQRGIDLADVARETRVPLRHLRAIEADAHDSLPALPYTLGFVKSYARHIGLDPGPVLAQFRQETTKTAHVPVNAPLEPLDERRLPSRGLVAGSLVALVAVIALVWAWSAGWFDPAPTEPLVAAASGPTAPEGAAAAPASPTDDVPEADAALDSAPPADPTLAPTAAVPVVAGSGAVTMTPTEDVWVRIYPANGGPAIKTGILRGGERFVVPGDPAQLLIRTGKAGTLGLAVNDRPVPPLGGPVETVSGVSLDPVRLAARSAPVVAPAVAG